MFDYFFILLVQFRSFSFNHTGSRGAQPVHLAKRAPRENECSPPRRTGHRRDMRGLQAPLRRQVNNEVNFPPKLRGARSRLYRRRFLQVNNRWKALAEIYTMHSFAPFWNPLAKNGEKGPDQNNPEKEEN